MTSTTIEDRLESLGQNLRQRPSLVNRVLAEVQTETESVDFEVRAASVPGLSKRRWPLLVSLGSGLAAMALLALSMTHSTQTTWADVVDAIAARPWLHARSDDGATEMWLSDAFGVWAFKSKGRVLLWDAKQKSKYEYRIGQHRTTRYTLSPGEFERILTINDAADGVATVGPWLLGTEQIIAQQQQKIVADGQEWIEFTIELARGAAKHGTLRVDLESKLPVEMAFRATPDAEPSIKWTFDYPPDGPRDVYALGAPAGVEIEDYTVAEAPARILAEMAASRARLGDFRMLVVTHPPHVPPYFVWHKGNRWRVDIGRLGQNPGPVAEQGADETWDAWWKRQLDDCQADPWYRCDGQAVYVSADPVAVFNGAPVTWKRAPSIGPHALMSADRGGGLPSSLNVVKMVYPDLTPPQGFGFEFDPHPADADGCVLFKLSARSTNPVCPQCFEWYWVDPDKGYAVVRAELFCLPDGVEPDLSKTENRQSMRMAGFRRSPQGFWYPSVIHESMPTGLVGDRPPLQHEIRYYIDFTSKMTDSLFDPT